jgi:hypothetical protein
MTPASVLVVNSSRVAAMDMGCVLGRTADDTALLEENRGALRGGR